MDPGKTCLRFLAPVSMDYVRVRGSVTRGKKVKVGWGSVRGGGVGEYEVWSFWCIGGEA